MRRVILLISIALACAWAGAAQAQSNCNLTGSVTTIDFGAVNPLLPGDTFNSGGLIKVNCALLLLGTRVCISIGVAIPAPLSPRERWAMAPIA